MHSLNMADLLDGVVEVLLYLNSKIMAACIKSERVVPVDEHHLRSFTRGYVMGLSTPFFSYLLVVAAMNILRKRFEETDSEDGRHLQSYIPSFTRGYVKDVSHYFFLNVLMVAPISRMMVVLMKVEKGDSGDDPPQGHIGRGYVLGSSSFLFCLVGIALVNILVERREKMRKSLIEEVQILRNQNLLLRSRLQMQVQRYLDQTRHPVRSNPFAQT